MICSVFSRIAVMFLNIHFGGALSGIDSNFFSQSIFPSPGARRFTTNPTAASTAPTMSTFFTKTSVLLPSAPGKGHRSRHGALGLVDEDVNPSRTSDRAVGCQETPAGRRRSLVTG